MGFPELDPDKTRNGQIQGNFGYAYRYRYSFDFAFGFDDLKILFSITIGPAIMIAGLFLL